MARINTLEQNLIPAHLTNLPIEEVSEYLLQQRNFYVAGLEYRATPIDPQINLFLAGEKMIQEDFGAQNGWSKISDNRINIIKVVGTHYSMMTPPYIEKLAVALVDALTYSKGYHNFKK